MKLRVLPAAARPRSSRPVFVTASVSNTNPYVGEQVLFVWRFYYRARIADPRIDSLDLGEFLVEDLGEVRNLQATEGGVQYEVSEIRKALFAQRPGTFVIPPSRLTVQLVQARRSRGVGSIPSTGDRARSTSSSGACAPRASPCPPSRSR